MVIESLRSDDESLALGLSTRSGQVKFVPNLDLTQKFQVD